MMTLPVDEPHLPQSRVHRQITSYSNNAVRPTPLQLHGCAWIRVGQAMDGTGASETQLRLAEACLGASSARGLGAPGVERPTGSSSLLKKQQDSLLTASGRAEATEEGTQTPRRTVAIPALPQAAAAPPPGAFAAPDWLAGRFTFALLLQAGVTSHQPPTQPGSFWSGQLVRLSSAVQRQRLVLWALFLLVLKGKYTASQRLPVDPIPSPVLLPAKLTRP
ncbi:hypothetical protein GTR04_0981 [Trichophyton interdigitale]|uniref:Uncharacterized protein n=1 Tax=Trichophyton interdigitale TaxID=101480 RepID=A0A9P4YHZ1_9EURO|nr:hypothetical protein GY631_3360 [Trichophyton interdigitale]KAF3898150.1 hypothetical protein GY632_1914 [Trichophyton interdigitale]KAG8211659.1 hypothetical protein GTR04_0981 [Trichophyton interdigitale]